MMPSSRIPSPARSQGVISTPRRYKPRVSRSVGSPAQSNTSVKLSALVQMEKFILSPMPSRRSVLSDTTDIDVPTRKSWWKKLDENSREVMDVLNNEAPVQSNNAIEEYIDIDILSQENQKKNYMLELPESSDGESISSIVIPQRKLFTQKSLEPQKKFTQIIDNRESLAKLNKTQRDHENSLNVGRKNLFNQGTKQRNKPLFPSALLNVSPNKTVANKTKDFASANINGEVKNLFGNRGGTKRKNMFADFIVSDSEDEIPEIQAKVFGFQKKPEQKRRKSLKSRDTHEGLLASPTCSVTDTEMDDWRLLPSSTMVDHQIEDGLRTTPSKKGRLSKLSEVVESINTEANITANNIKVSNKSKHSKNSSKSINIEINDLASDRTVNKEINAVADNRNEKSLQKVLSKSNRQDKSKSISLHKTVNEVPCELGDDVGDKHLETTEINKLNENKSLKIRSRIDQMLQSDDDEDFSLVYENDDDQKCDHRENDIITGNEGSNLTKTPIETRAQRIAQIMEHSASQSPVDKLQNKSNKESATDQNETSRNKDKHDVDIRRQTDDFDDKQEDAVNENSHRNESLIKSISEQIDSNAEKTTEEQYLCSADEEEGQNTHDSEESVNQEEEPYSEEEIEQDTEQETQDEHESDVAEENVDIELSKNYHNEDNFNSKENKKDRENNIQAREQSIQNQIDTKENEDIVNKEITNYQSKDILENQNHLHDEDEIKDTANKELSATPDSTERNKQNHEPKLPSPDICRKQNKTSGIESFTLEGRKTDVRRTKSNIKNLTIRQSLVPIRESLDFSDGSRNSSAEGSGWDSHRTTRATLRQTFGKDFTPRQSLRALVMEKSAKRRTNLTELNAEFSRFPQANSTELPITEYFDFEQRDGVQKVNKSNNELSRKGNDIDAEHKIHKSRDNQQVFHFTDAEELHKSDLELPLDSNKVNDSDNVSKIAIDAQQLNEPSDAQEMKDSDQEESLEMDDADNVPDVHEGDNEVLNDEDSNKAQENYSGDVREIDESDQEVLSNEDDNDDGQEINESDDAQEMNESDREVSYDSGADDAQEMNVTDDEQEIIESNQQLSNDEHSEDAHNINDCDQVRSRDIADAEEAHQSSMNVSVGAHYENHSDKEDSYDDNEQDDIQENNDSNDEQEVNESDTRISHDVDNTNDAQESNESDSEQDNIGSNHEASSDSDDGEEEVINESNEVQEMDEFEYAQESNEFDHEFSRQQDESKIQNAVSDREESRKIRQTTLEKYLQKISNRKLERKKQLVDEIMNTLKAPSRDMLNPFKVPAIPKQRRLKTHHMNLKPKPLKSSVITTEMLPAEVLEDMKYKPPKRYRPANASWITKRLYKFLETKLEPKYDYKARVRSEKLVETIYNFAKDIKRHEVAPAEAVDALKREMARLDVLKTHLEFYEFFHEYMPREVRVKVVPDLFNKISLPKRGVFSEILR